MAIKDEAAFEELKPYLKMTVAPNGVTVGDLNFVVAQTQWSTALITPTATNTLPADISADLFQAARGDVGQGFTTSLTKTQTSWQDSAGRLPANQVFIATACAFQIFKRSATTTNVSPVFEQLIPKLSAVNTIARNLSWEVTIGDGITRNYGSLLEFSGMGGAYSIPNPASANDLSVSPLLGDPDTKGRKLRIPLVFPPNISVRIKVRGGNAFIIDGMTGQGALGAAPQVLRSSEFLAVRQYLHGYLCTMPVG